MMINNDERQILQNKWNFQRSFFAIVGVILITGILLLTVAQIRQINGDNSDFAVCLLFFVYSMTSLISLLFTAVQCRLTNAVLTTMNIALLSVHGGVHFYLRYIVFYRYFNDDLYLLTTRLALIFILLILMVPWTNVLVREYRAETQKEKPIKRAKSTTFSWFLYLDFLLIISLFILTIRNPSTLDFDQILRLTIGLPLTLVWLSLGLRMIKKNSFHWLIFLIFFLLSLIEIFHFISLTYSTIMDYRLSVRMHHWMFIPLLILRCVHLGTHFLVHFMTMIISCVLVHHEGQTSFH